MEENIEPTEKKKPRLNSLLIGILFLAIGIFLFVLSIFSNSQVFSIMGLGLTFWGALFLLIPPPKHVEASYLVTSSVPDYMTIDRMLTYIVPKNEVYNIPPCPRDVNLPEHAEGLKQMVTFIPAEGTTGMVDIEDIARGSFLIERPQGLLITSPGSSLLERIEQKSKKDFTKIPFAEIDETLPYLFKQFNLSSSLEITRNEDKIIIEVTGSLYKDLYSQDYNLKSIYFLGCPLVNAVACAIAKSAGKPTVLLKLKTTTNGKKITATLKTAERVFEKRKLSSQQTANIESERASLVKLIIHAMKIVDVSFDILFEMRQKRFDWNNIAARSKDLCAYYVSEVPLVPQLTLDFTRISQAIRHKETGATSKEVYSIIKAIYHYFNSLSIEDAIECSVPNYISAKIIVLSYISLNDILFAKVVKDSVNSKQKDQLKGSLQVLNSSSAFNIDIDALMDNIGKEVPESDIEGLIDTTRKLFRQQFKGFIESD